MLLAAQEHGFMVDKLVGEVALTVMVVIPHDTGSDTSSSVSGAGLVLVIVATFGIDDDFAGNIVDSSSGH